MHHSSIRLISSFDVVVPVINIMFVNLQRNVLRWISKGHIVNRYVVRTCKIVNNSISSSNPSVSDHWQNPCNKRQRSPHESIRISLKIISKFLPIIFCIDSSFWQFLYIVIIFANKRIIRIIIIKMSAEENQETDLF